MCQAAVSTNTCGLLKAGYGEVRLWVQGSGTRAWLIMEKVTLGSIDLRAASDCRY